MQSCANPGAPVRWSPWQPDLEAILSASPTPLEHLVAGNCPALIIRRAVPASECAQLVQTLLERDLIFAAGDERIAEQALSDQQADRWTQRGYNFDGVRKRIDIGTSLGNLGDDREAFFAHAARTHRLLGDLFHGRTNPIDAIYSNLQSLSAGKTVQIAREDDGRAYGPAIIRVHYGGYAYPPHFDSVRHREARHDYVVSRFEHQLAGVLCIQNASVEGQAAQTTLYRQFWNPTVERHLKAGSFHEYVREMDVPSVQINLEPGDLYFFNTGMIHEVPGVAGRHPRIVLATFIGYSSSEPTVMVWS